MSDNKVVNPLTGRWITVGGKLYKDLVKKKIINNAGQDIRPKWEEMQFSLGNYIFCLLEVLEIILLNLTDSELWKIRGINKLTYKLTVDITIKRIVDVNEANFTSENIDELATQVYLTKGVVELEKFLKVACAKNKSPTHIKWSIQSILFGFPKRKKVELSDLRMLYLKYHSFGESSVIFYISNKEELLYAIKNGLSPLVAIKKFIELNIIDDDYFKILSCCKIYFTEDIFKLNLSEMKELMKKYNFWGY